MSDAREWLNGRPDAAAIYEDIGDVAWAATRTITWDHANAKAMRDALLAVLDECDAADARHGDDKWIVLTDDIRKAIDEALGVDDD